MHVEIMAAQRQMRLRDGVLVLVALALAAAMLYGYYFLAGQAHSGGCSPPAIGFVKERTPFDV